uniref:G_PROTEIN_RECEP_F1_2 domain-containing protein n=1 Tax=Rhabditophanes sp. KR3021 TaxID=114890 RepID=A0AC35TJE3_9BILA
MEYSKLANNFSAISLADDARLCSESEHYSTTRFLELSMASIVAFAGVIGNIILLYVLLSKKDSSAKPTLYPAALALFDCLLCIVYILMFGLDAIIHYSKSYFLFVIYNYYIKEVYFLSKLIQISIPYMLIFGNIERLIWTFGRIKNKILINTQSKRGRKWTLSLTIIFCIIARSPIYFGFKMVDYEECNNVMRSKALEPTEWFLNGYGGFDLYAFIILQTFFPFFVLLFLNFVIIHRMSRKSLLTANQTSFIPTGKLDSNEISITRKVSSCSNNLSVTLTLKRKNSFTNLKMDTQMRNAVITMTIVVASYLLSNSLHLILTMLEQTNSKILKNDEDPSMASLFHTYFSDLVSFVYMFTSAARILIYYICNPVIRKDLQQFFKAICHMGKSEKIEPVTAV